MTRPLYALVLDIDGPVASPMSRTLAIPSIAEDIVAMADAGIPIIFNTGRSDAFVAQTVMAPLYAAGLSEDAVVLAFCEKGATSYIPNAHHADGAGDDLIVDQNLCVPTGLVEYCRSIAPDFADTMFFDDTKVAMVSMEAHADSDLDVYRPRQRDFEQHVWDYLADQGIGVTWDDEHAKNGSEVAIRIDPTIISTDVEHVGVGKQVGAEKAVAYLKERGIEPQQWRTLGDSRSDYAMADYLHAHGYVVRHGDVRPADGVKERDYPVEVVPDDAITNDAAGALFFTRWRKDVENGEASSAFTS